MTVSIIIPARDPESDPPPTPTGALEIIMQGGPGGPAAGRNIGALRALGDILLFMDDDVAVKGDLAWFEDRPASEQWWLLGRYEDATGDPRTKETVDHANELIRMGLPGAPSCIVVRRDAFFDIGGYDRDKYFEDGDFACRLFNRYHKGIASPLVGTILRPTRSAWDLELKRKWRRDLLTGTPYRRLVLNRV